MRAYFYLLDGNSNASTYHRALQYFPLLRQHGIEPRAMRPTPDAVYQRLVERGSRGLPTRAAFYGLFALCRAVDVRRAASADVVVVQRDLFPFGPPLLERMLLRRNRRLVYDTDDATYLRPSFTPDTPFQRFRHFDKVEELVRRARWVSVATEAIASWARGYNSRVSVVPMAVDVRTYERVVPVRTGDRVVLGWAGTAGGLRYLHGLQPTLQRIAAQQHIVVRVVSGGHREVRLDRVPLDARPWRGLDDLASFDVGLLPLDDTDFERAKFPFKLLQYWALGLPVVASRVGIPAQLIEHDQNGLLADSAEEWHEALCRLLGDANLRRRLGQAGRQVVAANYTIERVGPLLVEGLLSAGSS